MTTSEKPPLQAGPPVLIGVSGPGNPNRVRQGNTLTKLPAAYMQDARGLEVRGNSTWKLKSNVPPSPGIYVSKAPGSMNGTLRIPNVQTSTIVEVEVSTLEYPNLKTIYLVIVEVLKTDENELHDQ
ncbi:hypothetical protein ACIQVE_21995 [Pseudomonas sp. NPDC098747]|uniref:hypothetical protein n=1 Tax=Pseudomonas sp. NPDC098747 TaxID=3364487 RepID=UPI00383BE2A9